MALTVGGLALLLLMFGLWRVEGGSDEDSPDSQRPNILIIVTDDQRSGLSVMPETRRWFVEGGTRFANAMVTTPICCPSRATIFTGRYAHNHGVTSNSDTSASKLDLRSTFQRYLQADGYRTGIFGKLLNGWDVRRNPPYADDWSIISRSIPGGYRNGLWNEKGRLKTVSTYSTTYLADRAVRFLEETEEDDDDEPWLLYIAPTAPHTPPYDVEARYRTAPVPGIPANRAAKEKDRSDKPLYVRTTERKKSRRDVQLRLLMSVDDLVGRVADRLKALGERNTLAIYVSDNGYLWGEHGLDNKSVPYLPSVRVPLMLSWPGRIEAGRIENRLATNLDIAPTVLEAAGLSPVPSWPHDGKSLLEKWTRDRVLTEYWRPARGEREGLLSKVNIPTWASITTHRYQYTEYYGRNDRTLIFREFYDLTEDPWQLVNQLNAERSNPVDPPIDELSRRLARDRKCLAETCP